jgi:hypothetical protein
VEELNVKKRRLRSLQGFFRYALDIIDDESDILVLNTNLRPLFWVRIKNVLKQNKKNFLIKFLFEGDNLENSDLKSIEIINLQNQINELKDQIKELQNSFNNRQQF